MATGTVIGFNLAEGVGGVAPKDGSKGTFVHASAVERARLTSLDEGQKIEDELVAGRDRESSAEDPVVRGRHALARPTSPPRRRRIDLCALVGEPME